jgi:hypothetical protein
MGKKLSVNKSTELIELIKGFRTDYRYVLPVRRFNSSTPPTTVSSQPSEEVDDHHGDMY